MVLVAHAFGFLLLVVPYRYPAISASCDTRDAIQYLSLSEGSQLLIQKCIEAASIFRHALSTEMINLFAEAPLKFFFSPAPAKRILFDLIPGG